MTAHLTNFAVPPDRDSMLAKDRKAREKLNEEIRLILERSHKIFNADSVIFYHGPDYKDAIIDTSFLLQPLDYDIGGDRIVSDSNAVKEKDRVKTSAKYNVKEEGVDKADEEVEEEEVEVEEEV